MTYKRKNDSIPIFVWCLLSIVYFDLIFVICTWTFVVVTDIIKNGGFLGFNFSFLTDSDELFWYPFIIALPIFVGSSISLTRSGVTGITIDNEHKKLIFIYQSSKYLFLKQKSLEIHFDALDYYVDRSNHPKLGRFATPFSPINMIVFFKDGHYLLKYGDSLGWTQEQFKEIETKLREIRPPCQSNKVC